MGIPYRQTTNLYLLIIILEDLISYKNEVINIKNKLLLFKIEE